jgi:hypothetical protein
VIEEESAFPAGLDRETEDLQGEDPEGGGGGGAVGEEMWGRVVT